MEQTHPIAKELIIQSELVKIYLYVSDYMYPLDVKKLKQLLKTIKLLFPFQWRYLVMSNNFGALNINGLSFLFIPCKV